MRDDAVGPDGSALSEELGLLPQPAMLRGVDEDYYTAKQMRAYGAQERAAERERCAAIAWELGGSDCNERDNLIKAEREIERLRSEREVQEAALANLRVDLRECAIARDAEIDRLRCALHDVAEEWAGAECGEPVHAQEAYAIGLAKRMYSLAVEGLGPNVRANRPVGAEQE